MRSRTRASSSPSESRAPTTSNCNALAQSKRVRTILVTDEQSASFMADGAWRASGQWRASVVHGAGLTHAMSVIAEAFMDTVPSLYAAAGFGATPVVRFAARCR